MEEKKILETDLDCNVSAFKDLLHFVVQNCITCSVPSDESICPLTKVPCLFNPQNICKDEI